MQLTFNQQSSIINLLLIIKNKTILSNSLTGLVNQVVDEDRKRATTT
jgi:hypothetical protein